MVVDIVNVFDMLLGNFYYYFKGKELIIEVLFDCFEEEMQIIFGGMYGIVILIEDNWVFIYIVFEEIYDFCFFYCNVGDMMECYLGLVLWFCKILVMKCQVIENVFNQFEK